MLLYKKFSTRFLGMRIGYGAYLGLILLACFLINSLTIKSYGASFDEYFIHEYADNLVDAYHNLVFYRPYEGLTEFQNLGYYGPAFWIGTEIIAKPLQAVFPTLDTYDAWHIVIFATFLLGAWCLFCLARRFTTQMAAFLAALLFLTQPLLWGHGVMNSKDTPFMTFFLASVLVGVRMVEELADPIRGGGRAINLFHGKRIYLVGAALLAAGLALVDLVSNHFLSRGPIAALITQAYSGNSLLHTLFLRLAPHAGTIDPSLYIDKAIQILNIAEFSILLVILGSVLAYWLVHTSPRNRWLVLEGVMVGMTISIRILGPAALGLVAVYAIIRLRRQAVVPLLACLGIGLVLAYFTWPYLWGDPITRFWASLHEMANFHFGLPIRFEGKDVFAAHLPWYYLPKLMAIQLTLPLLILAAAGLAVWVRCALRRSLNWGLAAIPLLWFLAPMGAVLLVHPSMYDNFRQFLFILPPLFLFAAKAAEVVFRRLQTLPWRVAFCLLVLLPGIIAGAWLHPYEYVYYNALVGWTGQVGRQYETDYWNTSMCEAAHYLSANAPDGTSVAIGEDITGAFFQRCAAKKFDMVFQQVPQSPAGLDYSVIPTRYDSDLVSFLNMPVAKVIGRGITGFTVIKKAP